MNNLINKDSPQIPDFKDLKIKLKPHQNALIYKTLEVEKEIEKLEGENKEKDNFLILGDLPGAGKTNVVLGHLYSLKKKLLEENPDLDEDEEERDPSWIIVPQNILTQWTEAINKYFPKKFKVKRLVNYEEMMSLYKNTKMIHRYDIILTTPLEYHMLVTTLKDQMLSMKRVIFDEIDTISSMLQQRVQSDFVWFVSASFKSDRIGSYYSTISESKIDERIIKCEEEFIASCFPLEEPEVLKYVSVNKYIDETLATLVTEDELRGMNAMDYTKMKNEYYKKIPFSDEGAVELMVEENRNEIEFFKIRIEDMEKEIKRLKDEIDSEGIEVPEKVEENEEPRVNMYREYLVRIKNDKKELIELEKKKDIIRNKVCKNRICMICYQNIEDKKVYDKEDTEFKNPKNMKEIFRTNCCKSDICIECVHWLFDNKKWEIEMKKKEEELKKKQEEKEKMKALGRTKSMEDLEKERNERIDERRRMKEERLKMSEENKERDYNKDFEGIEVECKKCDCKTKYDMYKKMRMIKRRGKDEKEKDRTSKIDRLEKILDGEREVPDIKNKRKFIIFSDFYNTFKGVKDLLNKKEMKFMELDGGKIETIDKSVKEYREGETQILLSNSTFFGCGLNMEFTTDIVFMHKMEKGTEKQVIGRAQRPGRTNRLKVHYIYYNNEEYGKDVEYESHTQFYGDEDVLAGLEGLDIKEVVLE